jgi:MoxR-like ATPase
MKSEDAARLVQQKANRIIEEVEKVIVGKRPVVELVVVALLAKGHVLIEDIPGIGKTTLAKAVARSLGGSFKRIQFTPDLLPGDVTGVTVYNQKTGEFMFAPGPVFANIVLADEINRATPKTQSSLLECMGEAQVTTDGMTRPMLQPFFVVATENPIEYRGTYPLPEAQLDRFLMRVRLGYTSPEEEVAVLDHQMQRHPLEQTQEVIGSQEVVDLQEAVKMITVKDAIKDYIVQLVTASRHHPQIALGSSPRGSLGLLRAAQAAAAVEGRDFVTPDDVKGLAIPILAHRLIVQPEVALKANPSERIVQEILDTVPVPTV